MNAIFPLLVKVISAANGDTAADTVGTVLRRVLDSVDTRREVMQMARNDSVKVAARTLNPIAKPTITGREMVDIAEQRPRSDLKKTSVPKLWADMVKEILDMLVFLCQTPSGGGPIGPYDKTTITMECYQLLNKQCGGLANRFQLTPTLSWYPPSTSSPFDGCGTSSGGCTNLVQKLTKAVKNTPRFCSILDNSQCALIFGDVPKSAAGHPCCAGTQKLIEQGSQKKRQGGNNVLDEEVQDTTSQPLSGAADDKSRDLKLSKVTHDGSFQHGYGGDAMDIDEATSPALHRTHVLPSSTQDQPSVPTHKNASHRLDTQPDEEEFIVSATRALNYVGTDQKNAEDAVMTEVDKGGEVAGGQQG